MNKNVIILLVLVAAIVGTLIVRQQSKQAAQKRHHQLKTAENANRLAAEAQKAINDAKRLEEIARQETEILKKKIATRIFEAKSLLDDDNYQKAIDTAKNVFTLDADNTEAKMILESAMAKLKEIAQQQIDALAKQKSQKMIEESDLILSAPSVPSIPGQ